MEFKVTKNSLLIFEIKINFQKIIKTNVDCIYFNDSN